MTPTTARLPAGTGSGDERPQRPPTGHVGRSHRAILEQMTQQARAHRMVPPWDPTRTSGAPDHGRGLLDAAALGLHVLWTYQGAWADEAFLPTARLPESVRRLLALVGYHPHPGFAAAGLQHLRCKEGTTVTLPPRFRVSAPASGDLPAATYETLRAITVSDRLNELRPFLSTVAPPAPTTGAIAAAVELAAPESVVPIGRPGAPVRTFAEALEGRLTSARLGSLAARNAARARQKARRVADVLAELRDAGAPDICGDSYEALCATLCEAADLGNQVGDTAGGPLSESQELLAARLRDMALRQPKAVAGLEAALARAAGESDRDYSARLDQLTSFLDALVTGVLQEARDQVTRLRGSRALTALDAAFAPASAARGVALPGTDALYLMPSPGAPGRPPTTQADLLRPGDWLVLAEDPPTGSAPAAPRAYREAVQVLRVRDEVPPGLREPVTRVTVTPALARRYELDSTVLIGNVVPVGHGTTTEDRLTWRRAVGSQLALPSGPLTWRQAAVPGAGEGRIPDVELTVADRAWNQVPDLRGSGPADADYAVEVDALGVSRVRVGDGDMGAQVPDDAPVLVRYRTGLGSEGNRPTGAVDTISAAHPGLAATLNPAPMTGGLDPEPSELSRQRASAGIHALDRAISVSDVASLCRTFAGVRDAVVLRDHLRRRDHLTVVAAGHGGAVLSEAERATLRTFLAARMPPGSSIRVLAHRSLPVSARLALRVAPGADPLAVMRTVRVHLGADDPAADERPGLLHRDRAALGVDVHASDLYGALAGVPGLESAFVVAFHRTDAPMLGGPGHHEPGRADRVSVPLDSIAMWAVPVAAPSSDPRPEAGLVLSWEEASDL